MIGLGVLVLALASCRNDRAYPADDPQPYQETPETVPLRNEESGQDGVSKRPEATDAAEDYFVVEAAKMELSEVEFGRLAQQKGSREAVRSFGKMLVQDRSHSLEDVKSLAEVLHIAVPGTIDGRSVEEYNVLKALSGPAFDQQFARIVAADHQKASKSLRNASVSHWADAKVPILEKQLRSAKSLLERKE